MDISVVIPVYNSEQTLESLTAQLISVLDKIGNSYEIIFVDDGSPDQSWNVLLELQDRYPDKVIAIQLMRNYGQHNALMCGFRKSLGRYVITMDDDLQNPPYEIPKLLKEVENGGFDLVYGRYELKKHDRWRNFGSALILYFYRIVFKSSIAPTSFRIINRELLESIFPYALNFTYVDGLLSWNTQRIGKVIVDHQPRSVGDSGYSVSRLVALALNLFTNFSLLPLQLVSLTGLLASTSGFLGGTYYLFLYLSSDVAVPGYASTIIAILMLGGIQLLALGIMGEYLGRLHLNVNSKPQYVVRQVIKADIPVSSSKTTKDSRL